MDGDRKQIFLDSYKALDSYLREILNSERGITGFIDDYEDSNDRKLREVYYQLKHLRWTRNKLDDDGFMVTDADIDDLRYVSKYFMKNEYPKTDEEHDEKTMSIADGDMIKKPADELLNDEDEAQEAALEETEVIKTEKTPVSKLLIIFLLAALIWLGLIVYLL